MTLFALVLANLKIIFRNRQSLFWALAFPLIFVGVFGLFNLDEPPTITIGVIDRAQDDLSTRLLNNLQGVQRFKLEVRQDEAKARRELQNGDLRYLLVLPKELSSSVDSGAPVKIEFTYDEGSPTSAIVVGVVKRFVDEVNLRLAGAPALLNLNTQGVHPPDLDYFDFLLPGFVGMGVMTYSIIGLASVITTWREQKILKRILATPLRVRTFFAGIIISHLLLSLVQTAVILAFGILLLDGDVLGNYLYIAVIVLLGNIVFLNIGFIVGSFTRNVTAASGLGNAVAMPMMFLSGVFFPTDTLPAFLPTAVSYLPLSPMLEAMRGVALDARPLWEFGKELGVLGGWTIATGALAMRVFKFG